MIEIFANNAQTTLATAINSSATSVTLLAGTGSLFPNPTAGVQFFRMTFNDALTGLVREIVFVTARSGDVCTIVRAQENTAAVGWLSGDSADNLPTAGAMANMAQQQTVQQNTLNYAVDTGSANHYIIAPPAPGFATPIPGPLIYFLAANKNTGASNITLNGGATYPLIGLARLPLQGGEVYKYTCVTYDAALASYVVLYSSGGSVQTAAATGSNQALSIGVAELSFALLAGSATQPFAASTLNTTNISAPTAGAGLLTINATGGVNVVNASGSAFAVVQGAKGLVNTSSNQFVTGAQLQNVFRYGEVKYWWGTATQAAVAAAWGPGWFLADGTNSTANLMNAFPIGAGSSYSLGQTGGATAIALGVAQLPSHAHSIYDPGHAHAVADPGHVHGVGDPGHSHGVNDPGHVHTWSLGGGGVFVNGSNGIGWYQTTGGNFATMNHAGTGIYLSASGTGIYLGAALTGIGIYGAVTGIQTYAAGSGAAFSIMPPFVGLVPIFYTGAGA
jgi:hypothetical protein